MVFRSQTYSSYKNLNKKFINRTVIGAVTLLLLASGVYSALMLWNNAAAAGTQVITGNTSSGENVPGWMFNRDLSTMTPFQFKVGNPSIGTGSVLVDPIPASPASNKFIAENFIQAPLSDVNSLSFDFKLADGRPASDGQHYYMNVYTNFAESDDLKFYDCRYNVIGTVGSTGAFTTLTFNPAQSYPVDTRGSSPHPCPAVPNDMDTTWGAGSNVRAFAVTVGDTSASDAGVSGYIDNVVVNRDSDGVTAYDFEAMPPVPPTITNLKVTNPNWGDGYNILNIPNHQSTATGRPTVGGNLKVSADFADDVILTNVISYLPGRGFFDQSEYTPTPVNNGTWQPVPQGNYSVAWDTKNGIDWRAVPDGDYTFNFEARDADQGQNQPQNSTTVPINLTVDNTAPTVAFTGTTPADGATVSGTINVQGDFNDVNGLMNTDIGIHAIAWYCHTDWPAVGTKSCSIDTTTLPDGPQQITMNGRDKAGNTFQVFRSITVNNDPPVITGTAFNEEPSGQSVLSGGFTDSQNFVFNLSSTGDTTRYQLKYWNDIVGSPFKEASPWNPSDLAGYSTSLGVYHDNFTQGNGKHYFSFSACDGMGNCSDYGTPFAVTFDNVDPSVPVHVSPADGIVTTTANQTSINWDDSTDANAVTYVYQSSLSSAVNGDGSFVAPAYTSGALAASEIPTPGTPEGTYHWHVKAVDAAGNESAWSSPWVIVVDNTAPVVTLDAIPDSDDTTPTLTGTVDDPDADITVSIDGGTPANATNNGDGTWTYTVDPALTTGDYTVTVAATDAAGNGTTPAPSDDFTVTEPVVVVTQTQGGDGAGGGTGTDGGTGGGGGGAGAPAAFFAGFIAGGAGDGDGAGDGAPADQGVQGDTNDANNTNGNVRAGDNAGVAAATTDQSGWRFNWWWLLILAALVAAFYGWYRYRQAQADKTL